MRAFILTILLCFTQLCAHAQFFNFGFGDPFVQRRQQPEEKVTKPSYKGGEEAMHKAMLRHFANPPGHNSLEGRIVIACILSEKGKVIETHIVSGIEASFNKEAARVASKLKFKPAKRGKKTVKSRFDITFPIRRGKLSFSTLNTIEV